MSGERLAEIREREAKATPGPLAWDMTFQGYWSIYQDDIDKRQVGGTRLKEDADFFTASRADVPYLLSLLAERDGEIAKLREAQGQLFHDAWGYAHDHPDECADGYNKAAFMHVQFWIDLIRRARALTGAEK